MLKKIIFVIGTLSNGGAERVVSNISMSLPENIQKEAILFSEDAKVDYEFKGRIIYLDRKDPDRPIAKIVTLINRIIKLKRIKQLNSNATIISFMEYPNILNMLSGHHDRSIVSVRNYMSVKHKSGLKSLLWNLSIKYLYKKARKVIVVSEQMKVDLVENYNVPKEKIEVIYNSYPIKRITTLAQNKLGKREQEIFNNPTIITAGRLYKQKGQHHLINAFKRVKEFIPHSQLVFLGEGRLENSLREKARALDIYDSVHFLGFQENPFKYIALSKAFVMTSYYEGFPNALAEAMICKIPVISTDCPSGPREILAPDELNQNIRYTFEDQERRYGFLVPAIGDENETQVENMIAHIILELLNNKEKWKLYSNKSYERMKAFDIDLMIKKWIDILSH